jgi:protein-L-isoaspartate(D-aspartate) O-methyltransferase
MIDPAENGAHEERLTPAARAALEDMVETIEGRIGPIRAAHRRALLTVNRARFVRAIDRPLAYRDEPLGLDTPHGAAVATISAPHMYALQFEALDLGEADRFLELGTGSGYGAALAAAVVGPHGKVTTLEVDPRLVAAARATTAHEPLAAIIEVLHDDGLLRADLAATHDKIALTFATDEPPRALLTALRPGAVLIAPVGLELFEQRLYRWRALPPLQGALGARLKVDDLGEVRFVSARPRID